MHARFYQAVLLLTAAAAPMLGCPQPCTETPGTPPTTIPITSRGYTVGTFPQPNALHQLDSINYSVNNFGKTVLLPIGVNWNWQADPADFAAERDSVLLQAATANFNGGSAYLAVDFWGDENRTFISGLPPSMQSDPTFANPLICPALIEWTTALAGSGVPIGRMGIGIEVNYYKYLNHALRPEYPDWLNCYDQVYDAVKAVSPTTKVFPTFLLEDMLGLLGQSPADPGQFSDYTQSKVDLLSFSTFPHLTAPPVFPTPLFATPADVPSNYWSQMLAYSNGKDIQIGETGWAYSCSFQGTDQQQAEWVNRAMELAQPIDQAGQLQAMIYYFMSDPAPGTAIPYFTRSGFFTEAGVSKAAGDLWHLMYLLNPGL
ncbi:MAG: hypothetical protein KC466_06920 [Myxococcales bacterium]|nr:hypothetical protein [Myxococcales bacterium]